MAVHGLYKTVCSPLRHVVLCRLIMRRLVLHRVIFFVTFWPSMVGYLNGSCVKSRRVVEAVQIFTACDTTVAMQHGSFS